MDSKPNGSPHDLTNLGMNWSTAAGHGRRATKGLIPFLMGYELELGIV